VEAGKQHLRSEMVRTSHGMKFSMVGLRWIKAD
jgi:hypothetical protein